MELLRERSATQEIIHGIDIPGACACGNRGAALALDLQRELRRLNRCHPWLCHPIENQFTVAESIEVGNFPSRGESVAHFAADANWPSTKLHMACRLLQEGAEQFKRCYDSFPDKALDIIEDGGEAEEGATSADVVLGDFLSRLNTYLAMAGQRQIDPECWLESLTSILDELKQSAVFAPEGRVITPEGEISIGQWLRYLVAYCQLMGKRLYRLGAALFGSTLICDSFCLKQPRVIKMNIDPDVLYPDIEDTPFFAW